MIGVLLEHRRRNHRGRGIELELELELEPDTFEVDPLHGFVQEEQGTESDQRDTKLKGV